MTKKLTVYLHSREAGILEQDQDGLMEFSYSREWLEKHGAVPLSRSLPLQSQVFPGKKTRPFFAGILPEEEPRSKIAGILGISDTNDFAMLERIGGECAGAVSLLPEGTVLSRPEKTKLRELTDSELEDIISELPVRPLLAGSDGLRLSLAGAQDKLPVVIHNGRFNLPLGDTPSTHILKPEPDRFPGLAANEFFCMMLARKIGLNASRTDYLIIGNKPCILVTRYDRVTDKKGIVTRIHQEDLCQALGYPPERKYQAEGGPALNDCISLIRDWSTVPVIDISSFINSIMFNVLIGNADAHGKNYSFLYSSGERKLAPLYDLVSTMAWPVLSKNLAMKIGSCASVNAFNISDWMKMAEKNKLGWPMIKERLSEINSTTLECLEEVSSMTAKYNRPMADKLHKATELRAERMIEMLQNI